MEPFNWEKLEFEEDELIGQYPTFTYDYYTVGGRYGGGLKLKVDENDEIYRWGFYAKEPRNGRLFLSKILSVMEEDIKPKFRFKEENYFSYMGIYDGFIYVDGAWAKDILNYHELQPYICIDLDGKAIARQSWDGENFIEDEAYEEKYKAILERNQESFVTVLAIHD